MKVRITIEYDTEEDMEYERKAWLDGNVGVPDILGCDDPTMTVKFEEV